MHIQIPLWEKVADNQWRSQAVAQQAQARPPPEIVFDKDNKAQKDHLAKVLSFLEKKVLLMRLQKTHIS